MWLGSFHSIFLTCTILNFFALVPDDLDGRLYRLCNTWGYFKYFLQDKCSLNWDTLLYSKFEDVLAAGSNEEFNLALMNMFSKVGYNTEPSVQGPQPEGCPRHHF